MFNMYTCTVAVPLCVSLGVVYYIAYISRPGSNLFSYHPVSMTVAFLGLLTGSILVLGPSKAVPLTRRTKIFVHWLINIISGIIAGGGFLSIYVNKNLSNRPHFATWHATFGLIACILLLSQLTFGVFAKYPYLVRKKLSFSSVRRLHLAGGVLTYATGCLALTLGLFSSWFVAQTGHLTVSLLMLSVACVAFFIGLQVMLGLMGRQWVS